MSEDAIKLALLILGFDETAKPTKEALAKAFKELSLKFHPDAGGTSNTFRGLSLAKEVVSNTLPKPIPAPKTYTQAKYQSNNTSTFYSFDEAEEKERLQKENKKLAKLIVSYFVSVGLKNLKSFTITYKFGSLIVRIKNDEANSIHYEYIGELNYTEVNMYNKMLTYMLNRRISDIFNNGHTFAQYTIKISYIKINKFGLLWKGVKKIWEKSTRWPKKKLKSLLNCLVSVTKWRKKK